ncbi:MAG: metabolite traffic protein EboE [Planctomycetota bacterium]
MLFGHPDHPGHRVRLSYCLNLHPAEDLDGVFAGMDEFTLPLAERLGAETGFGLGAWLAAAVAIPLGAGEGLRRYIDYVRDHGLDAFTYNAFPYGGFHRPGLKSGVFRPTWKETERVVFTASVARVASRVWASTGKGPAHVSISTHTGLFGGDVKGARDLEIVADNFARMAGLFARVEKSSGCRVVLALEPEPRASAGDTAALAELHRLVHERAPGVLPEEQGLDPEVLPGLIRRHLGTCLDACHSAVEFEHPQDAFLAATRDGTPLAKLQFSSALELDDPAGNATARERLFALDEPVYLHQVTGRGPDGLRRAADLPEVRDAFAAGRDGWRETDLWRCHFHVPVDLGTVGESSGGLSTTRAYADELLALALSDPVRWGTEELHLEIETYTWDVLPGEARGEGTLLDGLEREYRHVEARLAESGWTRAASQADA